MQQYLLLATFATLATVVLSIFGFAEGNELGLISGIASVINAPFLAALAYVVYRRIVEIDDKVWAAKNAEIDGQTA